MAMNNLTFMMRVRSSEDVMCTELYWQVLYSFDCSQNFGDKNI